MDRLKNLDYPVFLLVLLGLRIIFIGANFAESFAFLALVLFVAAREFYSFWKENKTKDLDMDFIKNELEVMKSNITGVKMMHNIKTKGSQLPPNEKFWGT